MLSAAESRMGRAALDWSIRDLAAAAQVGVTTINRFEKGLATSNRATLAAMQQAMEKVGVRFTDDGCVCISTPTARVRASRVCPSSA